MHGYPALDRVPGKAAEHRPSRIGLHFTYFDQILERLIEKYLYQPGACDELLSERLANTAGVERPYSRVQSVTARLD